MTASALLSKESIALVQHVELHKSGWWEKTVQRLVLATLWIETSPQSSEAIRANLLKTFQLPLRSQQLDSILSTLQSRNCVLQLQSGTFRIPEEQRKILDKEIEETNLAAEKAKQLFCSLAEELVGQLNVEELWQAFEFKFLGPLINEVGANVFRLVSGENLAVDNRLIEEFLKPFPSSLYVSLREVVRRFLDPEKPEVRSHIGRLLHARFCVDATGLSTEVLAKLKSSAC